MSAFIIRLGLSSTPFDPSRECRSARISSRWIAIGATIEFESDARIQPPPIFGRRERHFYMNSVSQLCRSSIRNNARPIAIIRDTFLRLANSRQKAILQILNNLGGIDGLSAVRKCRAAVPVIEEGAAIFCATTYALHIIHKFRIELRSAGF